MALTFSPSPGIISSRRASFASLPLPVIFDIVEIALSLSVPSGLNISFFTFFSMATSGAYCASISASHLIRSFAIASISALTPFTMFFACGVIFRGIPVFGS
jgi:hypothetical protein